MYKHFEEEAKKEVSRIMNAYLEFDLKIVAHLFVHHFVIRSMKEKEFSSDYDAMTEGMKRKPEIEKIMETHVLELEKQGKLGYDKSTMKVKRL